LWSDLRTPTSVTGAKARYTCDYGGSIERIVNFNGPKIPKLSSHFPGKMGFSMAIAHRTVGEG
jgi:hypothetical protein